MMLKSVKNFLKEITITEFQHFFSPFEEVTELI